MVRESGYSLRSKKEVDDDNVKSKTVSKKDTGSSSAVKANVSSLMKPPKAKPLENKATPSPGTRKSSRLGRHKTPSPLNMLDKGKKALASNSSGQKKPVEERSLSEEKTMEEKDAVQETTGSEKSGSQSGSGRKRKEMVIPIGRKMFKVQCVRTVEFLSDDEETEGADEFSTDADVTDMIVFEPSAVNGLKDSQSGPSLKESLSDHKREGTNSPSMMNLDSGNLERSFPLTRPQDGTVQSESADKWLDPIDTHGSRKLSVDPTVMGNVVDQPPDADGLKDSRTSLGDNLPPINSSNVLMDESEKLSVDPTIVANVVDQPSDADGLKDSRTSLRENVPPINSSNVLMDESEKLSVDPTIVANVVDQPSDADGLIDSCTSLRENVPPINSSNVLMDESEKLSVDPSIVANVVDQPSDADGLKDSRTSLREKVPPINSSNVLMDESEKLSVDPTIVANFVDQPSDADGLKGSCTSVCENMLQTNSSFLKSADSLEKEISDCFVKSINGAFSENGANCIHPEVPETTPSLENNSEGLSEICGVCSKRKRGSTGSPENDLCSCGATVVEDVIENLSRPSTCKDGADQEATVTTLETDSLNNVNLLKEPHSDHLIDGRGNVHATGSNIGENLRKSRRIADTRTSRFLEYWLPVLISNHQLEQYCAILLSSSINLWSAAKNDRIGALHDTLENVRKVCDHSYLRDLSLQERLIFKESRPAEEVLDIGIKASGKIELLDMMLTEIKSRGSQVLILFQSIRGENASNGDILADFLHKRFGDDSYEHVEGISPKKQDAVNRFNKKEKGAFVFLLETRACSSTIKLLSLDTIIIYNSDWNPLNDIKALQKMSIGSKSEQIKVFRLYSSLTCEERSLILAKRNANTEGSLQTSSRAIIDNLLMWGASDLFSKLNDYIAESNSSLHVSTQQSFLTEVIGEFRSILSESCDNGELTTVIAKVHKLEGGGYSSNIPLLGQKQIIVEEWQEPHVFWRNLLDRKTPRWKLSGEPCSRNRKRSQYLDELPSKPDAVNGDVGNKRRKAANVNVDPVSVHVELNWTEVRDPKGGPSTLVTCNQSHSLQKNGVTDSSNLNASQTCNGAEYRILESAVTTALPNVRKGPHSSLLGQLMELCNILKFPDGVTDCARRFLDYIINNHHVNSDSPATLHAFILSLCWVAASISKQKVDKKESLLLAKQHLNYQCTEEVVRSVYSKMRLLKKMHLPEQDVNREPLNVDEGVANLASSNLLEVRNETLENPPNGEHETNSKVSQIERNCLKRQKKLMRKHQEELQELKRTWEEKKQICEKDQGLETAMVRALYSEGCPTRTEKLNNLEDALQLKLKKLNLLMEVELKNLVAAQDTAMKEEKQKAESWLGVAKAHASEPTTVTMPPIDATGIVTDTSQLEDQNPNGRSVYTQGNDAENPAPKDQSVKFTTEARAEVPQTAQKDNVSIDKNNSSSTEQLNLTESVPQSQPNLRAEVSSQVDAVTTVQQSNGVLQEGQLQEVELQVEDAALTTENQSTINSESVPVVDLMPIIEQPDGNPPVVVDNHSQCTSTEIQVEVSRQVDRSNNAMSDVELQNQDVPALENGRKSDVANSDLVGTVGATEHITEELNAEQPAVESQSTFYEVPISETAENLIHLQPNIEEPGSDQGRNSSRIAEVTGTELLRDEPVPQNDDLNMRSVAPQNAYVPTSSQNNVAVTQTVDNSAEPANEDAPQEGINVNLHHHHRRSRVLLNPAAHQLPFVDPLQYELEIMTKEKDQLQKNRVDMAARLKSDCEKEMEEMMNQIKQKYQMKLQEAETEHTIRNTKVEMNIKKMQANMKLAESFRYKCLDVRLPGPSGNHQGAAPSGVYMQQIRQLAMLPSMRQPTGASPTFQSSSTSQQNPLSIIQHVRPHPMRPSTVTSNSVTATAATTVTATPVQCGQHTPSPLFASPPSRPPPPLVSSTTSHNPRMSTRELRSPATHRQSLSAAPHLQPVSLAPHVQSASAAPHLHSPAPHLQSVSPAPHLQSSRPSPGQPVPPITPASRPQYQPLVFPPHTQQSIPQASQNGAGPRGRLPTPPNQSTSAVALLMEMDRGSRAPASVPQGVSPSSELGGVGKNVHNNRPPLPGVHDVVCLSDDD